MVQRQLTSRQNHAAVLARVPITQQNVLPAQRARLMRNSAVLKQTNHRGHGDAAPLGMQGQAMLFLGEIREISGIMEQTDPKILHKDP